MIIATIIVSFVTGIVIGSLLTMIFGRSIRDKQIDKINKLKSK